MASDRYVLRFLRLASLPPWTDECPTMVFSLGNSFRIMPLNQDLMIYLCPNLCGYCHKTTV